MLDKHHRPITANGRKADPFDLGAGFVNPKRVLDPGLLYEATPTDYKEFLCSIGYNEKSVRLVTRNNSTCNHAFPTAFSLNYPSITVPKLKESVAVSRTVTNVGRPRSTYRAVVVPPSGINVTVVPNQLVFNSYGQKINYTVIFKVLVPAEKYVFGSLSWRNKRTRVSTPLVMYSTRLGLTT